MTQYDAVVLGAGDAGLEVASRVADSGGTVAVAYLDPYLGTCLNTGCNPSKFLIERSRIAHQAHRHDMRVQMGEPVIDLAGMVDEKNAFIADAREGARKAAMESEAFALHKGHAEFVDAHAVRVGDATLTSERIFVATGARPSMPDIPGIDSPGILTNESLMELREVPARLAILGGGYIACELGQAFSRFGSKVTIIQHSARICPREEPELSESLREALETEGITIVTDHEAIEITPVPGGFRVDGVDRDGWPFDVECSHLAVATGRTPNTDSLQLDRVGVETDERGAIVTDAALQTNIDGIWAIGDVNGEQPFTRVGQLEGQIAYQDAFGDGSDVRIERQVLPHAIFTDPEIGSVGLTEAAAKDAGFDVEAATFPVDQVQRAFLAGEQRGAIKLVVERPGGRLLGCHVAARNGAELVYDAALVMRLGGTVGDLGHAVGTFPTMQEGIEGASRALAHSLHHQH